MNIDMILFVHISLKLHYIRYHLNLYGTNDLTEILDYQFMPRDDIKCYNAFTKDAIGCISAFILGINRIECHY